jgi:putative Mg2+ transporter-C (MgtC) family protein
MAENAWLVTLQGQPWEVVLRLLAAGFLGGVVGAEREHAKQDAGLRTNILVALGACLFTVIALEGIGGSSGESPSRVIAQIVSGIGFLGAGTVFRDSDRVRGLTTAATVWLVSAIGAAAGTGQLFLAVAATVIALVVLVLLRPLRATLAPSDDQ